MAGGGPGIGMPPWLADVVGRGGGGGKAMCEEGVDVGCGGGGGMLYMVEVCR